MDTEKQNLNETEWAELCKRMLRATFGVEAANEYINEAEHQDGLEYWPKFKSLHELRTDFRLYQEGFGEE